MDYKIFEKVINMCVTYHHVINMFYFPFSSLQRHRNPSHGWNECALFVSWVFVQFYFASMKYFIRNEFGELFAIITSNQYFSSSVWNIFSTFSLCEHFLSKRIHIWVRVFSSYLQIKIWLSRHSAVYAQLMKSKRCYTFSLMDNEKGLKPINLTLFKMSLDMTP